MLSAEHAAKAKQMGIDLSNFDWKKVLEILFFVLQLLKEQAPKVQSVSSPGHTDHACLCREALILQLQAAQKCAEHLECCMNE